MLSEVRKFTWMLGDFLKAMDITKILLLLLVEAGLKIQLSGFEASFVTYT